MVSRWWAVAPLLLGALTACGSAEAISPGRAPTGSDPDGRTYVVTSATQQGKAHALVPGSQIRLGFSGDRLTINAGCNTMSGSFQLEGDRLTVADLASTEMGCDFGLMEQDSWVAGLFAQPVRFTAENDAALISGDVVLALADRKTVSPDAALTGTHWVLDTIIDGETASSVPQGQNGTLSIDGGSITLFDGCNDGNGSVTVAGENLTFADISLTTRPCPTSHAALFHGYADVFHGTATYKITEKQLTITNGSHGLGFHAVQAAR